LSEQGPLSPAAMERTLAAVGTFAAVARAHGADLACIATSAVRRATNAVEFGTRIRAVAGVPLQVLSGKAEATASFRGATAGAGRDGSRIAVLDIGGGSTECAVGVDGTVLAARSIEIGSVRVAERYPALSGASPGARARAAASAARRAIRVAVAPLRRLAPVTQVRCVAGTPLTLAAVVAGSHAATVAGTSLTRDAVDATIERLLDLDLAQRRALPGMLAQRADIIVAGAVVLSESLCALGTSAGLLEADDLLLGFLLGTAPVGPSAE